MVMLYLWWACRTIVKMFSLNFFFLVDKVKSFRQDYCYRYNFSISILLCAHTEKIYKKNKKMKRKIKKSLVDILKSL